jgi:hypothetical protein
MQELKELYRQWRKINDVIFYVKYALIGVALVVLWFNPLDFTVLLIIEVSLVGTLTALYVTLFFMYSIKRKIGKCKNCGHYYYPHERKHGVANPCTVRSISLKKCNCSTFDPRVE